MTARTRRARPFDPRKLLHDAVLVIREEIAACESFLARFARAA
jgi:hypothetical protein